ncbi:hypothetical protein E1B28_008638 [Marasmius oreades]|uniref:Kinetochore protein Spc24 n=1 Tax=Marasmius oreades TaxID=181124 RepID=A0A9P7RYT5_9AGAR|nr:uncharacterized protein E1B28_008638 [Marasmius oreades]KAG7092276.1 hypothetical protein E1B28_008638 [Marasmius oreades]
MISESPEIEAIRGVIKQMTEMIDPDDDFMTIATAEDKLRVSEANRQKEIQDAHSHLKTLARILEAARTSSTRAKSVPTAEAHVAAINELDRSLLSLKKSISDAEEQVASREAELAALKEEARRLEEYDPALEHEKELDGTALRLTMYKGLGFEPLMEKDGTIKRILIRSQSGDIHSFHLDEGMSDEDTTRRLWKLAAS